MPNPIWKNPGFIEPVEKEGKKTMTLEGVLGKASFCFVLLLLATAFMWARHFTGKGNIWITLAALAGGLGSSYVSYRLPETSLIALPIHAVLEGLAVGGISAILEVLYPGVPLNAVLITFCAALLIILAYRFRLFIRLNRIIRVVFLTLTSIGLFYILGFIFRLFSISSFQFISPIGIGICLLLAALGSWNLVSDMEFIEGSVQTGARKRYEWTAVLGLLVTMGWVYLEFFRLLNFVKQFLSRQFSRQKERLTGTGRGKAVEEKPPEQKQEDPLEEQKKEHFPYG